MFPVIEVPADAAQATEAMGSKPKFWYRRDRAAWQLFKQARFNTGEDWAEKLSERLCDLLGLPHARYDLAQWGEYRGVVSESFLPENSAMVFGNEILFRLMPDYPRKGTGKKRFYRIPQHTVGIVMGVVENPGIHLPVGWVPPAGIQSAADVFCGYLLLDAWIGNTDRHHENWAIVVELPSDQRHRLSLAATYDHASSLGSHITDAERADRLSTRDQNRSVAAFASRARSAFFQSKDDPKPLLTHEAFRVVAQRRPEAAKVWLDRLASIPIESVTHLISLVPPERLSPVGSEFVTRLLQLNQERLCGGTEV